MTIKKHVRYVLILLKFIGLWTDQDDIFKTKYYWKYSLVVNIFFMGSFNMGQFIYLCISLKENLENLAASACVVLICLMANIKAYFYLRNWHLVKKLIEQLDHSEFQPKNDRQQIKFYQFFRLHMALQFVFIAMVVTTEPLWLLMPVLLRDGADAKLPFHAWYPYDWKQPFAYKISYLHQLVGLTYVEIANADLDLLTIGLITYIGAQCDLLSDTLSNLSEFTAIRLKKNNIPVDNYAIFENMNNTLIDCLLHHRKILQFARDSNKIIDKVIFAQFASSLLGICMTMFELSVVSPKSMEFITIAVYQVCIFNELLIYCWFGNEATDKSNNISQALYEAPWMDCPKILRRHMLFFNMSTRKPIRIYGLSFFALSLVTFTSILRASWSFFAMLHQVHINRENNGI